MLSHDRHAQIQHLIDINRYKEAKHLTQDALSESPSDPELFYFLSQIYFHEEAYEDGVKVAEYGLALAPKDQDLRYILSLHYQELEEYAEAESIIIDLIRDNPRHAAYIADYAYLMLFTFHIKKARALIDEALRIAPNDKSALLTEVLLDITEGHLDESALTLQNLIKDDPQSEHVLRMLIMQLVAKKRYKAALMLTQQLFRNNPLDTDLLNMIIELRALTHWSALPLWPIRKLGLIGVFILWFSFILMVIADRFIQWPYFIYIAYFYIGYCIYSWIQGPAMRRIIRAKGA